MPSSATDRRLAEAGFVSSAPGAIVLAGPAADLFQRWSRFLSEVLGPVDDRLTAPAFIDRHLMTASRYLAQFPKQVVVARGNGAPGSRYLTPAACLHVYGQLEGERLKYHPYAALVTAPCARSERGRPMFPFRLSAFHMTELVVIGDAQAIEARACQAEEIIVMALARLGIEGSMRASTDAFFLPTSRGSKILQQLKQLKREFTWTGAAGPIALGSINRHEDFFTRRFRITLADAGGAQTFCLAFGLERLTAAGLLTWGADTAGWPAELRP